MSISTVIIDTPFSVIHRFRCNHISFTQLCHDCSIPQFVCDLSYFLVESKCFTSMKLFFTISLSTEEITWNEISQITIDSNFNWIRLRRVFRWNRKIELSDSACFRILFNFCLLYTYIQDLWNTAILCKCFSQVLIMFAHSVESFQLRR